MSAYKRKRASYAGGPYQGPSKMRKSSSYRSSPRVIPGKTRTGGYYGRFAGKADGELKFFEQVVDDATVAQGGTIQTAGSINDIPQGVTESTRVGRKCTIKSIHCRMLISLPTQDANATPALGDSLRYVLYMDKQCNGATAAVTDIFEQNDFHSFRNLANSGRFVILKDTIYNINYAGLASDGAGVVSQGSVTKQLKFNVKCNAPIEFNSTTGAITEIRSNNFGVCLFSSSGVLGFFSNMRLRFSDGA